MGMTPLQAIYAGARRPASALGCPMAARSVTPYSASKLGILILAGASP